MLVTPEGSKLWRMKYRFNGKEKLLSFGGYPALSLTQARAYRADAQRHIEAGTEPSEVKKADKSERQNAAANCFEVIANEWFSKRYADKSPAAQYKGKWYLHTGLFPYLGCRSITEIKPAELLAVLQRYESKGAIETARRLLWVASEVFIYAMVSECATANPALGLGKQLQTLKVKHRAAITDPKLVGPFLRAIDGYGGTFVVRAALQLAPLVFVRPGELRLARWVDVDFAAKEWRYHVSKTDVDHIVPLSTQAAAILSELHTLTGRGAFVFPSARAGGRPMSDNTLNAGIRTIGYTKEDMTAYGFRAMARTILDEVLGVMPDFIEHQLAHKVKDPNGRAYNRTAHLPERHKMMQTWADYLDRLKAGADVIELGEARIRP